MICVYETKSDPYSTNCIVNRYFIEKSTILIQEQR